MPQDSKKINIRKKQVINKVLALILTIITGLLGIYFVAALHLEGYLGITIAVMGYFIIQAIENKK